MRMLSAVSPSFFGLKEERSSRQQLVQLRKAWLEAARQKGQQHKQKPRAAEMKAVHIKSK
eukprot:scaffold9233_cov65-Skeletonema_dohrnii-CCMP3373.AAC.2